MMTLCPETTSYAFPTGHRPWLTFDELWSLQVQFLDNFIFPANIRQLEKVNSTLLAENVHDPDLSYMSII